MYSAWGEMNATWPTQGSLAPSTKTRLSFEFAGVFEPGAAAGEEGAGDGVNYAGRNFHFGIREHGMAAAINGMALHGGVIPYGGTFFCFTDYCRPSIRLAALMGIRSIFVMTHDSIGLGADGPTHQPIEHLAAMRVVPNLLVLRPCDAVETAECWQIALESMKTPSILVLTRQKVKATRQGYSAKNLCAQGAYEISPSANSMVR